PAAYGLGGTEPTVTDANVVLGRIGTRRQLGGSITVDRARARTAVADLARHLGAGMTVERLAEGIVTIAVAKMTSAIRGTSFHRLHETTYGHADPGATVELVNARLSAYGLVPKPAPEPYRSATRALDEALLEGRTAWFAGERCDCPVWERERLPEGAALEGPA